MPIKMNLEKRKSCDYCAATAINGVFCHERTCPNEHKEWVVDEWREVFECPECGGISYDEDYICCEEV